MAALAAARLTDVRGNPVETRYPVNALSVIYKGALVVIDTDGYARPAVDTSGFKVVGVAIETVTGGAADGDVYVRVQSGAFFTFAASSITQAMVPDIMYVVDDQTIDETTPANSVKAGILVRFISTTEGEIYIPPCGANVLS